MFIFVLSSKSLRMYSGHLHLGNFSQTVKIKQILDLYEFTEVLSDVIYIQFVRHGGLQS